MTVEILSDKVKQLVNVSNGLLQFSKRFEDLHNQYLPKEHSEVIKYKTHEIVMLLRLQHCLYFFDVLLNLNSLLRYRQDDVNKKEISFFELLDLIPALDQKDEIKKTLNELRRKLKDNKMDVLRHKFDAHKDYTLAFDPEIMYLNFINPDLIIVAEEILNELNNLCIKFLHTNTSNSFQQLYDTGHQKLFSFFEKELREINYN